MSAPSYSGRTLYGRLRDFEREFPVRLVTPITEAGIRRGFPDRMCMWSREQTAELWPTVVAMVEPHYERTALSSGRRDEN